MAKVFKQAVNEFITITARLRLEQHTYQEVPSQGALASKVATSISLQLFVFWRSYSV